MLVGVSAVLFLFRGNGYQTGIIVVQQIFCGYSRHCSQKPNVALKAQQTEYKNKHL